MRAEEASILDLGCGRAKHRDAFGIDRTRDSDADLVHDLEETPFPVPGDHFERIYCQDVIEHIRDVDSFVREIHRVSAPGALIDIRTPHFSSWYSFNDPTHVHHLGYFFLDHYVECPSTLCREPLFRYVHRELIFARAHRINGVSRLANRWPARYEQLFAFAFPCENMLLRLRALK